jgi:tetratricopeptide (TPR) repeat protein
MPKLFKFKILFFLCLFMTASTLYMYNFLSIHSATSNNLPVQPTSPSSSVSSNTENPSVLAPSHTSISSPRTVHVSDSEALVLYKKGLNLYYQRQFSEALKLFNQALAIDPHCYEALNGKGAAFAFQGNYTQGLALIQQALELNPSYVYGNFNRGLVYELAGNWNAAIEAYQKTIQLDHEDTWSYYGIASIYGRLGNIDKVLEYLQPAIALNPDVKEVAREEKDFTPVRENPRFKALIAP